MSMSQVAPVFVTMAGAAFFSVGFVLDKIERPAPPPIEVHSIRYVDGVVFQDRTVTPESDSPVRLMPWSAQVVFAGTGRAVQNCTGSGLWPYDRGRITAQFDLAEWTGRDQCRPDVLPRDTDLQLRAVFGVGDAQVVAMSQPFGVTE